MLLKTKKAIRKLHFLPNFLRKKRVEKNFSFPCLNLAQFLGVLNDNIYKLLTIYFLLSVFTKEKASLILSVVGALYVAPFLLFSSAAGLLADRFSKQKLIRILKGSEIVIMIAAYWAFSVRSEFGCYLLLFLLATHSAAFGPSKYGILPELVEKSGLPKANGHLTAFTYLAMIGGTFLASYLTEISHGNFLIGVSCCLFFSLVGFAASFGIQPTPRQKPVGPESFFLKEMLETVREFKKCPLLIPALFGSAYFLFIGAFTQLNIIPLAIISLGLSEYAGGYLFLLTAVGIAAGSFLTGRLLKKKPSLGLSCLAGVVIGILFVLIGCFASALWMIVPLLILLGIFGGVFIISFDTFIQINSPEGKRGQTVAAANFLSFTGVLIASVCLYVFGDTFGFSPAGGFLSIGVITLLVSFILSYRLAEVFLPFLARNTSFYGKIRIADPSGGLVNGSIFVIETPDPALLTTFYRHGTNNHLLLLSDQTTLLSGLASRVPGIHCLPKDTKLEEAIHQAKSLEKEGLSVCIVVNRTVEEEELKSFFSFFPFKGPTVHLLRIHTKEHSQQVITVHPV